jgi:hypothetical protein
MDSQFCLSVFSRGLLRNASLSHPALEGSDMIIAMALIGILESRV